MHPTLSKSIIAAFDFDGTITTRDTLLSFLFYIEGRRKVLSKLATLSPAFLKYACNCLSRQQIKEAILTYFFAGMQKEELQQKGEAFARSKKLQLLIRPEAKNRIAWHRNQNHLCILVSAGIEIYLLPWAQQEGFNHVICSLLETDDQGVLTGRLEGLNCWGPEKIKHLEEYLGPREQFVLYAYGDSKGDHELLEAADYPFFKKMPSVSF